MLFSPKEVLYVKRALKQGIVEPRYFKHIHFFLWTKVYVGSIIKPIQSNCRVKFILCLELKEELDIIKIEKSRFRGDLQKRG